MSAARAEGQGGGLEAGGERAEEEDFQGPGLGSGPVWRLRGGLGAAGAERDGGGGALFRCGALLEQALSCSELADMAFVFDDGGSGVRGHRGMLCGVSGEFRGMFGSGFTEAKTGEVRVRGVGRGSFRGFLEFLYLGRPGQAMESADGREVWMLADLYDVQGIKDWLVTKGLEDGGVCAAAQYALEGGLFLSGLLEACKGVASSTGLSVIGEGSLRGMSVEAAGVLLEAFLGGGERFKNGRMLEGFKFVERWARANGGLYHGSADVESLVGLIELGGVSPRDLLDTVRPSGLLSAEYVDGMYEERMRGGAFGGRRLGIVRSFEIEAYPRTPGYLAVSPPGPEQRVASSCLSTHHVDVFDVRTGARVFTLGTAELPLGRDHRYCPSPKGLVFSDEGELLVCLSAHSCVCVFDGAGRFVREIEGSGGVLMLDTPCGIAVSGNGDIFVVDQGWCRVLVFRRDWTFLRFLQWGEADDDGDLGFNHPFDVAVGPDGRFVLVDLNPSHVCMVGADRSTLVHIGSEGEGAGRLHGPRSAALSAHGEVLIVDLDDSQATLQVFSQEGACVQSFGREDIGGIDAFDPRAVAVDADGRVFVSNHKEPGELLMLA